MGEKELLLDKYRRYLFLPRNIIVLYLFATIILYFFGPVKWRIDNGLELFLYVTVNYACVWIGYTWFMKNHTRSYKIYERVLDNDEFIHHEGLLRGVFIFSIVSHFVYSFYAHGGISIERLLNMAQSYLDNRVYEQEYNRYTQILTYLWGINYFALPCGIVLFKKLKTIDKVLFFGSLATEVMFWLSIGTMKGIGDIAFTALIPFLVISIKGKKSTTELKRSWDKRKRLILVLAIIVFVLFGYSSLNRYVLRGHTTFSAINRQMAPFVEKEVMWPFAEATNSLIVDFTHGYTGLAYAFKLPFEWTYFVGNSRALTHTIERMLNTTAITDATYCQRLQIVYGWANGSIWPTAFTWLASDFTFWFIPALLIMVSYLWAKSIYEALIDSNIVSLVYSTYLTIFMFYLPMNNQIVQAERSLYSLVLLTLLYIFNSSKFTLTFGKTKLKI